MSVGQIFKNFHKHTPLGMLIEGIKDPTKNIKMVAEAAETGDWSKVKRQAFDTSILGMTYNTSIFGLFEAINESK